MLRLKRIVVVLAILSSTSFAGTMGPIMDRHNPKENLYAGVGVGGAFNSERVNTDNVIFENQVTASDDNNHVVGNLFIGYGHTFANSLFLGIEANTYFPRHVVNFYSPGVTITGPIYQDQYAINDYLGLDLLPGYRVNSDLLLYGRAGLSFRDVSINQPQNVPDSPSYFNSTNTVGGRFGAGATYALSQHIAASVDYVYSYFPTFSSNWPLFNLQFNLKTHSNYAGVSLVYTV